MWVVVYGHVHAGERSRSVGRDGAVAAKGTVQKIRRLLDDKQEREERRTEKVLGGP